MTAIWFLIKGLAGNAIAQYGMIALVGLGAVAWLRHDAAAPYKATIVSMKNAAEKKEAITEADTIRADVAEAELAKTQAQLESLLHDQKPVCRLSGAELDGLRRVAAGSAGRR
jgi:hypothetical protein